MEHLLTDVYHKNSVGVKSDNVNPNQSKTSFPLKIGDEDDVCTYEISAYIHDSVNKKVLIFCETNGQCRCRYVCSCMNLSMNDELADIQTKDALSAPSCLAKRTRKTTAIGEERKQSVFDYRMLQCIHTYCSPAQNKSQPKRRSEEK